MKIHFWCLLFLIVNPVQGAVLFELGGKKYSEKDLSARYRQSFFDADKARYENYKHTVDAFVFGEYLKREAAKQKVRVADLEKRFHAEQKVTDQEIRKWYEQNKHRLGDQTLERLKGDIATLLKRRNADLRRDAIVAAEKKKGGFRLVMKEPVAPTVSIDVAGYPRKGSSAAPAVIVEFADYQCPHCRSAYASLKELAVKHKKAFQLVFIDFPINPSGISRVVAQGAYCARQQKKFWEFHEQAFQKQSILSEKSPEAIAKDLKLDLGSFRTCLNSKEAIAYVRKGKEYGEKLGVNATPTIFVNGVRQTSYEVPALEKAILAR